MPDPCDPPNRLRIKSVREAPDAEGGVLYELQAITYLGDGNLEEGTVLKVVAPETGD